MSMLSSARNAASSASCSCSCSSSSDSWIHPQISRRAHPTPSVVRQRKLLQGFIKPLAAQHSSRRQYALVAAGSRLSDQQSAGSTYGQTVVYGLTTQKRNNVEQELFGLSPADVRKLTARIKQAKNWRELRDLLQHSPSLRAMDAICLSAAFNSLARVSRGKNVKLNEAAQREVQASLEALVQLARPRLAEMDAQGLVSVAVTLAKLERADAAMFSELMQRSQALMPQFSPQALANIVWALATAGHQPCGAWLTEYYRRVEEQVEHLNSQDVANIMYGLAKFDLMPDVWLMDGLVRRALTAVRQQAAVSGQDPATVIQCLARYYYTYNFRVCDEWLQEYLAIVQPNLGVYMPFDLVSILHSMVVMNHLPNRAWMADYYVVLKDRLMFDPALSYGDFQRLMWALSRVEFTPTQSWQRDFVRVSIPKLRHLKYRALSELVWALACWGCKPSPEWLAEFLAVTLPKLDDFRPHHMANTMSALARLGCRVDAEWLDAALASFKRQMHEAKAHDLVTMLDTVTAVSSGEWRASQTEAIRAIADRAASKFAFYDLAMHTKLCVALAAANIQPGVEWLRKQQLALASCLALGDSASDTQGAAQELQQVYKNWDAELDKDLAAELESIA